MQHFMSSVYSTEQLYLVPVKTNNGVKFHLLAALGLARENIFSIKLFKEG